MKRVFIDGSAGTTGLRIHERLAGRRDITVLTLDEANRKSPEARKQALLSADVAFLCLPDEAAREAVAMVGDADTILIDTSTAHRVNPAWAYGFPELGDRRAAIASARRIANPGCHASGFLALVTPLVAAGLLPADAPLSAFSMTGYSGGGKKMIAEYEGDTLPPLYEAPRAYALGQHHKHLPEMQAVAGLTMPPVFTPVVAPYYAGMEVSIGLHASMLNGSIRDVKEALRTAYPAGMVRYVDDDEGGFLSASAMAGRDDMQVAVFGNEERLLLVSRFDNLGKGASGAAIQNMNIVLGLPEDTGLVKGDSL